MILALRCGGVSDGGHSADVMKNQEAIANPGRIEQFALYT
jgi:hypothetical protein